MIKSVLLLSVLALTACGSGGGGSGEAEPSSVTEAVSVPLFMYVEPSNPSPVPPKCRLYEDPNRQTALLTMLTIVDNATVDSGTYNTAACQAILLITATDWATMSALLADNSQQTRVDITYDSSGSGLTKPLIGNPVFSHTPWL